MNLLNDNLPAVLKTLDDEKMYIETIFSQRLDGVDYLYWYSMQGEGGIEVQNSEHPIDQEHLKFWRECIDPDFTPQQLLPRVSMIPDRIRSCMS